MAGFDDLLAEIEGNGWYQKRLIYFLLGPVFFLMPFAFLNQIFVLSIPDHWCTPPEQFSPEALGINLTEWKRIFLPQELGPDYSMRASQCRMHSVTEATVSKFISGELPGNQTDLVYCGDLSGWTYDHSEFVDTAVTDNDWVCELQTRATDLFTLGCVGLILGTAVFSWLADAKGRRLAFFLSTIAMIIFQMIQIWVSHSYGAFLAMKILAFACRAFVIGLACITWSLGNCVLPLIGYLIPRWKWLVAICTLPMAFIFCTYKIIPESPRWLVTVGKMEEAKKVLIEIAETNGAEIPSDMDEKLKSVIEEHSETAYGYVSLFKNWQMAKRTVCVTIAFTASAFVYYQLVINIGNMAGNTFLNMFLLGLVEGPGCVLGVYLSDKIGRRWSHFSMLGTNAVLFFVLMFTAYNPNLKSLVIFLCMWIKLNISGTFVVSYVQAIELFPTSVRQSGIGFATLISQTISIGGPYVIYLGATDLKLPYLIMFLVCAIGAIAVSLLPETLGATLPETLDQASVFGKNDKFFSFLPSRQLVPTEEEEAENWFQTQEKESLFDWNILMKDVVDGNPKDAGINPTLVKDLLQKHFQGLKESNV